jgi:hypothetical protein
LQVVEQALKQSSSYGVLEQSVGESMKPITKKNSQSIPNLEQGRSQNTQVQLTEQTMR